MDNVVPFSPKSKGALPQPYLALYMDEDMTIEMVDGKVRMPKDIATIDRAMLELAEVMDTMEYVRGQIALNGEPDPFADLSPECPQAALGIVLGPAQGRAANDNTTT